MAKNSMKDVWMRKRKEDERMELLKAKKRGDKADVPQNDATQAVPGEKENAASAGAGEEKS